MPEFNLVSGRFSGVKFPPLSEVTLLDSVAYISPWKRRPTGVNLGFERGSNIVRLYICESNEKITMLGDILGLIKKKKKNTLGDILMP